MLLRKFSRFFSSLFFFLFLSLSLSSYAAYDCRLQFYDGQPPSIPEKMQQKVVYVCAAGYTVLSSYISKDPVYSAEWLTRERLEKAKKLSRINSFHADKSIPPGDRAELSDYRGSGYDRGHMAPNKDMATREQQYQSFSLANMVPQNPNNNRGLWRRIENATRNLVKKAGVGYVVTGPAFIGASVLRVGENHVYVPTNIWKAVYIPSYGIAGAYWTKNADGNAYEVISLNELEERTGIDVFPTLSNEMKSVAGNLLPPSNW